MQHGYLWVNETAITQEITMTVFKTLRAAVQKRAAYIRTRNELRALPLDVALDLNIYQGDADKIAWRAVYS